MKSAAQIERDFIFLAGLVAYMKSFRRVRFVTASEALAAMPDAAQDHLFSTTELGGIADGVTPEASFQVHQEYDLAASEVLDLLNHYVAAAVARQPLESVRLHGTLYGRGRPSRELTPPINVPWCQFSRTVLDVENALESESAVPDPV